MKHKLQHIISHMYFIIRWFDGLLCHFFTSTEENFNVDLYKKNELCAIHFSPTSNNLKENQHQMGSNCKSNHPALLNPSYRDK